MSFEKDPPPPYPYLYPPVTSYEQPTNTFDVSSISDYLPWSILNLFFGWGIFGIVPLILSIVCRNDKSNNNLTGARTMSTLALTFNIIVTFGGIIGWVIFIILATSYVSAIKIFI